MAPTTRSQLRAQLTERLVPAILEAGFEGPAAIAGNRLIHEYRRSTPAAVHVLSIQLEKRGLPRFVINLHVELSEAMREAELQRGGSVGGRLTPRSGPTTRSWFRADPPWWLRLVRPSTATLEAEAVTTCSELLPEVEAWWEAQQPSQHIRSLQFLT